MKQITNKTVLIQGDKTYQPVEVDGVIYWLNPELPIEEIYPQVVIEKLTTGEHMLWQIDNINDIDRSCQYHIIAQSSLKVEGIPIISLDSYVERLAYSFTDEERKKEPDGIKLSFAFAGFICGYNSNPNQYTLKDIEKAIDVARLYEFTKREILEQINSISIINVDEQFNIISYE
jgi:hypothetical protein